MTDARTRSQIPTTSGGGANKNKSFEKVSVGDLRHNLSRLRTKKRLVDGNSIQKIMNETMDNYKTNLRLKQGVADDLTAATELQQATKPLKQSAKSLALGRLVPHNQSERFKNMQTTESAETTHLPKINVKFKAYEDISQ